MTRTPQAFSRRRLVPWIVIAGVAFTSVSAILIRLSNAPPLVIAAYRMGISAGLMLPFASRDRRGTRRSVNEVAPAGRKSGPADRGKTLGLTIVSGVFLAAHFATWIGSVQMTSVAHATVLVTLHPVIVAIVGGVVLKEVLDRRAISGVLAALVGAIILGTGSSSGGIAPTVTGDVLAFLGAVAVSGYILIGRFVRSSVPAGQYNFRVYVTAALVLFPAAAIAGQPLGPYPNREFLIFFALAFVCTLLGHSVFNWALKYVRATSVSSSILLEPVFATVMAFFLFGEIPGAISLVGAILVFVGIFLVVVRPTAPAGSDILNT